MPKPFYQDVTCTKARGGKYALWHARKPGVHFTGAGGNAELAIKDLQKQINLATKQKG